MADGDEGFGLTQTGELMLYTASTDTESLGDFDELYRECRPELVRYAERRKAQDAELLADLALLDVYRASDRLRSDHPRVIWAYLYRALDNHLKREGAKWTPELRDDLEGLGDSYSFEDDVIGHLSLDDMLALLSSNQQNALRPKLEKNLSAEEIGTEMGKSPEAVRQLQHKAIRRLRQVLFVVAGVLLVVLAAVMSNRDATVDQSPATSGTEQLPPETTVSERPRSSDDTLLVPETTVPSGPTQAGEGQGAAGQDSGTVSASTAEQSEASAGAAPTTSTTAPPVTELADPPVAETNPPAAVAALDPNRLAGSFALVNLGSGDCLDQPSSQEDGAPVAQWRCAGHTALNQILVATEGIGGSTLAFSHSNKCLDESNQVISQWTCNGGDNQLFSWNGSQLQSKGSGLCLTLGGEAAGNGSTLRTTPCVNSPAQQFRLERYGAQLPAG